ncbi:hypothetical protein LIER_34807 [Lithospermum erythrorhizon]|uniref:Uncharacterized protein n=1 Tax=Lithospermum erythrorhizon TaxID=34254 RepID=A0AAV3S3I9_LITER
MECCACFALLLLRELLPSSVDPTVAEILAGMKTTKPGRVKGGRIKRSLRKQEVPVRHVKRESPGVNPNVEEAVVDSIVEN